MIKKTKKFLGLFLAILMFTSLSVMAETAQINAVYDLVSVRVNGNYLNAPSYLYNDYVYVPLRAVSEAMGAEVLWDGETNSISITTNAMEPNISTKEFSVNNGEAKSFDAHINYVKVFVDGQEKMFSHFLYNGTTYVPVSVFYDHFGCHVMQHQATLSVRIYESDYKAFGENEALYVNDTAYTPVEISDISKAMFGRTTADFTAAEDFLISATAINQIGDKMVPKDGFEEYYKTNGYDATLEAIQIENKESFVKNVIWYLYNSDNLNKENVGNYFKPTDEALAEYLPKTPYGQGRWLKAKHILISNEEDAKEILETLKKNPEQFDSLMATYSEDPGSIAQPDGYLFTEGDMVTEFYEGTLPLQVGEISDLVKSQYGYHIILKVADYENGVSLEDVKAEVENEYLNNAVNNLYIQEMAEIDTVFNRAAFETTEQ